MQKKSKKKSHSRLEERTAFDWQLHSMYLGSSFCVGGKTVEHREKRKKFVSNILGLILSIRLESSINEAL